MTAHTPIDIASPVYQPHVYPERVFCSWNIRSDRGSKVSGNVHVILLILYDIIFLYNYRETAGL